ncbi:MAG: glycosyltransferase [Candidatus Omnitrophota bacterium]
MNGPRFTVIIATYNREDLLPRAISSVLGQTFKDFELLVIDNGSTDGTRAAVEAIKDPRLKYILNPQPTASCDAPRNLGIKLAKGSLIAFLDDDDIWYPQRLEKVNKAFEENPDVAAVCHNEFRNISGRRSELLVYGPWGQDMHERLLYDKNCLSSCATTIKTGLLNELGGFDLRKEFGAAADYDFWLRMTAKGAKTHFIEEPLGEFNFTGKNWSVADTAFQSRVAFLIKTHILNYEKRPLLLISTKGMRRLFKLYFIAGRFFLRARKYKDALKCFSQAALFIIMRPILLGRLFSEARGNIDSMQVKFF